MADDTQIGLVGWPLKKYREIKRHVSNLTPYKKWKLVAVAVDFILRLVGIHVMSDCKRNWRTLISVVLGVQFAAFLFYTVWYYWDESKITSIQPFSATAIAIPVI